MARVGHTRSDSPSPADLLGRPNFELIRHDVTEPINLEVDQIYADARKNGSFVQLGDKFLVMKNAGRVPTSKYPQLRFWTQIMNLAQKKRDAKLYAEAMKARDEAIRSFVDLFVLVV